MAAVDSGLTLLQRQFESTPEMSPEERSAAQEATKTLYDFVGALAAEGLCTRLPAHKTALYASFGISVPVLDVVFRYRCSPSRKALAGKCEWTFRGKTKEKPAMYELCPSHEWFPAVRRLEEAVLGRSASQAEAATWWSALADPRRRDRQFAALRAFCLEVAALQAKDGSAGLTTPTAASAGA